MELNRRAEIRERLKASVASGEVRVSELATTVYITEPDIRGFMDGKVIG
jgi:hypothetical protein